MWSRDRRFNLDRMRRSVASRCLIRIRFLPIRSAVLHQDNQGSIAFSLNEVSHSTMRHIALREQFIRDLVRQGDITPTYVKSQNNLADLFTKALPKPRFITLCLGLNIVSKSHYDMFVERGSWNSSYVFPIYSQNLLTYHRVVYAIIPSCSPPCFALFGSGIYFERKEIRQLSAQYPRWGLDRHTLRRKCGYC